MFSRSSKRNRKKVATQVKKATVEIVKPEQNLEEEPAIDLNKAIITITEPEGGLMIEVNNKEGEDK